VSEGASDLVSQEPSVQVRKLTRNSVYMSDSKEKTMETAPLRVQDYYASYWRYCCHYFCFDGLKERPMSQWEGQD
jgi:uncharacterized protein YutD